MLVKEITLLISCSAVLGSGDLIRPVDVVDVLDNSNAVDGVEFDDRRRIDWWGCTWNCIWKKCWSWSKCVKCGKKCDQLDEGERRRLDRNPVDATEFHDESGPLAIDVSRRLAIDGTDSTDNAELTIAENWRRLLGNDEKGLRRLSEAEGEGTILINPPMSADWAKVNEDN